MNPTMSYSLPSFSIKSGIAVQAEQLARWKRVLTRSAYSKLAAYLAAENAKLDPKKHTGYDVVRGGGMDEWLHNNLMNRATTKELTKKDAK